MTAAARQVIDAQSGRTAEMHTQVRAVLRHHGLTAHGDGVLEADLIEAVLAALPGVPALLTDIDAYALPDGSRLERCRQRDGSHLWAVRKYGGCLNRNGYTEDEPQPSSRSDDFMARCRFASAREAYATWVRAQELYLRKESPPSA